MGSAEADAEALNDDADALASVADDVDPEDVLELTRVVREGGEVVDLNAGRAAATGRDEVELASPRMPMPEPEPSDEVRQVTPPAMFQWEERHDVLFTIYHPKEMAFDRWDTLLVYAHIPDVLEWVQTDAEAHLKRPDGHGKRRGAGDEQHRQRH